MPRFRQLATSSAAHRLPPMTAQIHWGRWRGIVLLLSHFTLDAYAVLVPVLLGLLEVRCRLSTNQLPWVLAVTPLAAGLSQPIFAWLSDRWDTRVFAAVGLGLAAIFLCLLGMAENFRVLVLFVAIGYLGAGLFHPIAASSMGQLSQYRRGVGISAFFVAGMLGSMAGSMAAPRIVDHAYGFDALRWWMIPGVMVAVALHMSIRNLPHRQHGHHTLKFRPAEIATRWRTVLLLYVTCVMRAMVYTSIQYLYVRWAPTQLAAAHGTWSTEQLANAAAPLVGNLNAATIAGMGLGGLAAGFVRNGREKWPLVLIPLLFSPAIVLLPYVSIQLGYLLGLLAGIGFAATVPVSLSLAQRLLPHRTSLASALMMGGTWAVAALGPRLAEWGLSTVGLPHTFAGCAMLLAISGLLGLSLQVSAARGAADHN